MSKWKKCKVDGCLRPMKAQGLCDAHYNRLHHAGLKPELPVRSLERKQLVQRKKTRHHSVTG